MRKLLLFLPLVFRLRAVAALTLCDLVKALNEQNLTLTAKAVIKANETAQGRKFIRGLMNGDNYTLFVPTNAALEKPAFSSITSDLDMLAAYASYHVLPGNFMNASSSHPELGSAIQPNHTIGRTLLCDPSFVHLDGNHSQAIAWTRNDTNADSLIYIVHQEPAVEVLSTVSVGNVLIATISEYLTPPRNLSSVLSANNLSSLAGMLNVVTVPAGPNNTNVSAIELLEEHRGYTLFAPDNAAIGKAADDMDAFVGNMSKMRALARNHIVNGTSFYSPNLIPSTSLVSAAGEPLNFVINSSGLFVVVSDALSAKIISTDLLVENGVVHVIDRVLVDTDEDENEAGNAYSSASSAATQSSGTSGPIQPTAGTSGASSSVARTGRSSEKSLSFVLSTGVAGSLTLWIFG